MSAPICLGCNCPIEDPCHCCVNFLNVNIVEDTRMNPCPHCGNPTYPDWYHEGPEACERAKKLMKMRPLLIQGRPCLGCETQPCNCWSE